MTTTQLYFLLLAGLLAFFDLAQAQYSSITTTTATTTTYYDPYLPTTTDYGPEEISASAAASTAASTAFPTPAPDCPGFLGELFGSFDGNLSDTTQSNGSLTWQLNSQHNVSWVTAGPMTVDLLLVSELEDEPFRNNITIQSNITSDSLLWNVSVSNLSMPSSPPIRQNVFFFELRRSNDSTFLIMSQNFTIPNAIDEQPDPATVTVTATPDGTLGSATDSGNRRLSTGDIVGIAIGATAAVALALLGAVYLLCMRRRNANQQQGMAADAEETAQIRQPSVPNPDTALHSNPPSVSPSLRSWPLPDGPLD